MHRDDENDLMAGIIGAGGGTHAALPCSASLFCRWSDRSCFSFFPTRYRRRGRTFGARSIDLVEPSKIPYAAIAVAITESRVQNASAASKRAAALHGECSLGPFCILSRRLRRVRFEGLQQHRLLGRARIEANETGKYSPSPNHRPEGRHGQVVSGGQ